MIKVVAKDVDNISRKNRRDRRKRNNYIKTSDRESPDKKVKTKSHIGDCAQAARYKTSTKRSNEGIKTMLST